MKRSPLRRRTPLRSTGAIRRRTRIRQHRTQPRDRGDYEDTAYLEWLREQPCRVPGCTRPSEAHHLRHSSTGASLGAHVKDDRRAISLCGHHHRPCLHDAPWEMRELLGVADLKVWQDEQLEVQRTEWKRRKAA